MPDIYQIDTLLYKETRNPYQFIQALNHELAMTDMVRMNPTEEYQSRGRDHRLCELVRPSLSQSSERTSYTPFRTQNKQRLSMSYSQGQNGIAVHQDFVVNTRALSRPTSKGKEELRRSPFMPSSIIINNKNCLSLIYLALLEAAPLWSNGH